MHRPSALHRRAIYFPVDESRPRFIWLPFTRRYEAEISDTYDMPERGNLLGPNSCMELIPIRHNKILARKLQDTISLMVRDAGLIDGSALNQSVASILDASQKAQRQWAGPMIAYGEKGTALDPNESRDIDMADFRHLVDEIRCRTEPSVYTKENCMSSRPGKVDRTPKALETGQITGDRGVGEKPTAQHLRFESVAGVQSTNEVPQTMALHEEDSALLKTVCTLVLYCVAG
jgi:hypothetical protein